MTLIIAATLNIAPTVVHISIDGGSLADSKDRTACLVQISADGGSLVDSKGRAACLILFLLMVAA